MDRRHFLFGASALGLTACAKAERNLYSAPSQSPVQPQPEPQRPSTTMARSDSGSVTAAPATAAPATSAPAAPAEVLRTDGLPFYVPEQDLPGLRFVAAAAVSTVSVYATAQLTEPIFEFTSPVATGGPLVFAVEDLNDLQALKVMLPTRPNGSVGWINSSQVRLSRHNYAIKVRLDDFSLTVTDREATIFETTVGVGRSDAPTPSGRCYTAELLRPPSSGTAYGPYAYGLSGYSDTFTNFLGGPGQLGIHGTNQPWKLGTNVSAGCVRLHNDDITHLVETLQLPLGVPVDIV